MRVLLVLAALVLMLAVWWASARRQVSDPVSAVAVHSSGAAEVESLAAVDESTGNARTPLGKQAATLESLGAGPTHSRIVGRAVDDGGAPLVGAKAEVHVIRVGVREASSSTSTADATGRFACALPFVVPADAIVKISMKATSFHAALELRLPQRDDATPHVWTEGDNDIGDIVLARSGTLRGRVLTAAGVAVELAFIELYPVTNGRRTGTTTAKGAFELRELPPDSYKIGVRATGWISRTTEPIVVSLSETTTVPDIVLAAAPSIRGVVVDEEGAGVSGMRIEGTSPVTRETCSARTRGGGAFDLILSANEPVWVKVRGDALDFEDWEGQATVAPGTDDVRVVLKRLPRMRFFVVDEQRAPIERFELTLSQTASNSRFGTEPFGTQFFQALTHHPRGEWSVALRGSNTVLVRAPKHVPVTIPIVADAGRTDEQTIVMESAARITGRVLLAGGPCFESAVSLSEIGLARGSMDFDMREPVVPYGNRRTNTDGVFEFDELHAGSYALQVITKGASARDIRPIVVARGQALDLGDIEMAPAANVRGVVLSAPGESPLRFRLRLDQRRQFDIDSADGRFEFVNVDAGSHTLEWSRPAADGTSVAAMPRTIRFDLVAGEERELVIDTRPCSLTVHVVRDGKPVPGVTVRANSYPGTFRAFVAKLEPTNANGLATAVLDPEMDAVALTVLNSAERILGRSTRPIELVPGGRVDELIRLETGTLVVVLPETLAPVSGGKVSVWFDESEQPPAAACAAGFPRQCRTQWTSGTIDFGELAAQSYDVTLTFEQWFSKDRLQTLRLPHTCHIDVTNGAVTRIVVP